MIHIARFGTGVLPTTKLQPKAMLSVVDKSTVQCVVEDAVQSGAENILFVTGRGKRANEDYFDYSIELLEKGFELLEIVRNISNMISVFYVRQKQPKRLGGDAIYHAKEFVNDEPLGYS